MAKALIVYATRSGATKKMAGLIAEGLRFEEGYAKVVNVSEIKKKPRSRGI